jgi:hypothetical protein
VTVVFDFQCKHTVNDHYTHLTNDEFLKKTGQLKEM